MNSPALLSAWREAEPARKCEQVQALDDEAVYAEAARADIDPLDPGPGRPPRPLLVAPREVRRRGLGSPDGRAALVHAVAHIEFNAINLALDAALRFGSRMPAAFRRDWISVARDEARHFSMLADRLRQLGHAYGDLPAHNGLWEAAVKTADDPLARMALVPRVLEARGLDVTPGMINRLEEVGDRQTSSILRTILDEEVRHVAIGTHWFRFLCERRALEPVATFRQLLAAHRVKLHPPFNQVAREQAGFDAAELEP